MGCINILVEYEDMFDEGYRVIEEFEYTFANVTYFKCLSNNARVKVVKTLLDRGVLCKSIKEIRVEYER